MMKMSTLLFVLVTLLGCQSESTGTNTAGNISGDTIPTPDTTMQVGVDYLTGRFDPSDHPDFTEIETAYADREGMWLRKEAYGSFKKMHDAAADDGIALVIRSATRNFYAQKKIWEAKWTGERILDSGEKADVTFPDPVDRALKILEYSSMPGTSRHHWGTDIDLNMFNNQWFESGEGKKIYDWLIANAGKFGFCQVYTEIDDDRPYGYKEEKWHWSYLPLARNFTNEYARSLNDEAINGFKGAEVAEQIEVVRKYVLGIDPACK